MYHMIYSYIVCISHDLYITCTSFIVLYVRIDYVYNTMNYIE